MPLVHWLFGTVPSAFLHVHLHFRHFHGPAIDYGALAFGAFLSGVGIPGPGESLLIAAAVLSAKHNLDITSVVIVAFVAVLSGGIAGWLVGRRAGRGLMTAPGPLRGFRVGAVQRGDSIFRRYTFAAVLLTPSWVAGIHHVRTVPFMVANAVGAVIWAVVIGVAAYLIGPSVVDAVSDEGLIMTMILAGGIVGVVAAEIFRRRRRRTRESLELRTGE